MRVLWFTNTPSSYKKNEKGYNGGGWIASLEQLISTCDDIKLGVSFFYPGESEKKVMGNTSYYPIDLYSSKMAKYRIKSSSGYQNKVEISKFKEVIDDFKPDLIHVFGSERSFGLLTLYTKVPLIIHIQGILNPYLNAWYPPGINRTDFLLGEGFFSIFKNYKDLIFFKRNSEREEIILANCQYFMGRTKWDSDVVKLYSPNSKYFYCNEVLRSYFYLADPWQSNQTRDTVNIVTTISKSTYKGFDVIIKAARLLQEKLKIKFTWDVYGIADYDFWKDHLSVDFKNLSIDLKGVADEERLVHALQNCDVFVHPSYIDNSPNSVCEAQLLGVPVIASNVGGISSLVDEGKTGFLVPANDPFSIVSRINEIVNDKELAVKVGYQARLSALKRHDRLVIKNTIRKIYRELSGA